MIPGPLAPVGTAIVHGDGSPALGVRRGVPALFDYSRLPSRFRPHPVSGYLRAKKWIGVFAATDAVLVTVGVLDGHPTSTAFVTVADRATGEILADAGRPGAAGPLVVVGDRPAAGHRSRYRMPGTDIQVRGDDRELRIRAVVHRLPYVPLFSKPWLELDLRLDIDVHEGITAVSQVEGGDRVSATSKSAGLPTRGQVAIHGGGHTDIFDLTGLGGYDYTNGHVPRHLQRCRAFATGTLSDGRTLGVNLAGASAPPGTVEQENVAWLEGLARKMPTEVQFTQDAHRPRGHWSVTSADGRVDLSFSPAALRGDDLNLGVVRTRHDQVMGHFSGIAVVDGEELILDGVPGLVEEWDLLS